MINPKEPNVSEHSLRSPQSRYVLPSFVERTAYHTGQPIEQIERDADRDRWFTAEEAKEYGFVDKVIRSAVEVPTAGVVS